MLSGEMSLPVVTALFKHFIILYRAFFRRQYAGCFVVHASCYHEFLLLQVTFNSAGILPGQNYNVTMQRRCRVGVSGVQRTFARTGKQCCQQSFHVGELLRLS